MRSFFFFFSESINPERLILKELSSAHSISDPFAMFYETEWKKTNHFSHKTIVWLQKTDCMTVLLHKNKSFTFIIIRSFTFYYTESDQDILQKIPFLCLTEENK